MERAIEKRRVEPHSPDSRSQPSSPPAMATDVGDRVVVERWSWPLGLGASRCRPLDRQRSGDLPLFMETQLSSRRKEHERESCCLHDIMFDKHLSTRAFFLQLYFLLRRGNAWACTKLVYEIGMHGPSTRTHGSVKPLYVLFVQSAHTLQTSFLK